MTELALQQPELIGREEELNKLKSFLSDAVAGKGSTTFISGEAGIGKTRLVSELIKEAESRDTQVIQGWCLAESLEPLMPIKSALREAGLFHLISGDPPPVVVSTYLMNNAGLLIAKAEKEELELDPYIFTSMLNAVGNFVKDSMRMVDQAERTGGLNILGYKEFKIIIEEYDGLHLATVTKGSLSEFLVTDMKETLTDVQKNYGTVLKDWDGDIDKVVGIENIVSRLVRSGKYDGKFLVDDPKIRQENLFDNVLLGLQRLSTDKPLLLFFDDLQWADPSTLAILHYLARNTKSNRVQIVGSYRTEDIIQSWDGKTHQLETTMQNMNKDGLLDKIELKRLDKEGTEELVNGTLGNIDFENNIMNKIYKETEGTPFFVLEVVKMLTEEKAIKRDKEDIWRLVTDFEKLDIPSKVYDVVKRRLDRLIKEQRKILDCASVVGEEFQSDVVGKVMGLGRIQLLENLSEIEKTHKLIHSFQKKYVFDHAKVREVLYNGIIDELKAEYHKIVGDTIAELHKDNLDEVVSDLAFHYYEARDERAGEYLVKAGDKAKEEYANEEAVRLYENSLDLIGGDEKAEVLEKLADIQALIGEYEIAIENYKTVGETIEDRETKARVLRKIGDVYEKKGEYDKSLEVLAKAKGLVEEGTAEQGRMLLGEGNSYYRLGDFDKAMPLVLEAIEVYEKAGTEQKDIGKALLAVGNIHSSKGEYDPALEYYEKSLAVMEECGDQYGIAAALGNIGLVHHTRGELERALEYYERSLEIQEKIGDKQGIAISLNNIGNVHGYRAESEKCLEFHWRSLEIKEKIGDKQGIAYSLNYIGNVYYYKGEIDRALEFHKRGLEIKEKIGDKQGIAYSLKHIGNVYWNKGELDRALEFYERSLEIFERIGNKGGIAYSLNSIGIVHHDKGELDRALEFHRRILEICLEGSKWLTILAYCGLAEVNLELGYVQKAFENVEKGLEIALEIGERVEEGMSRRVLGMVYRETKDWDKAVEEFDMARILLEEVGQKRELAKVFYECGLLWKAKGEPTKAKEHLDKALSMFSEMGMKLWMEKSGKLLEEIERGD